VVAERTGGEVSNAAHRIPVRGILRSWAGIAWLLCWITAVGCRSTGQADSTILASVVLRGNTPGQIGQVTREVFQKHEYTVAEAGLDRLVFEKKGSGMNNLAYGSWLPDEPIWVRVRASIVSVGEEAFRLQCRAWLVRDRGSAAEEEIRIGHMHHRPYDELLGEVAARLGVKAAAPP
jgi:hypothetical protein